MTLPSRLRRPALCLALLTVACTTNGQRTPLGVSIHFPEGLSSATPVATMSLSISSVDISPPIVQPLAAGQTDVTIDVPSGPARLFEVVAYDSNGQALYYGRLTSDLPSSSTISLNLGVYPAGTLAGNVAVLGAGALPDGYYLVLTGQNPPSPDYAHLQLPIVGGTFSHAVPADTYAVSLGGGPAKDALQLTDTLVVTQGATTQVTLVAHPANQAAPVLSFTSQPPTTVGAGAPFTAAVSVVDSLGNVVTAAVEDISLELQNGSSTQLLTTQTSIGGVAQFAKLDVTVADANYVLVAHAAGFADVASHPFAVVAGPYAALAIGSVPATLPAGGSINPVIVATDAYGNPVSTASSTLAVGCPGNANCPATVNLTAGTATFPAAVAWDVAGLQTIAVKDPAAQPSISASVSFTVVPGAAVALVAQIPGNPNQCDPSTTQVTLKVEDAFGNLVTSATGGQATVNAPDNSNTLHGTLSVPMTNGAALFTDISLRNTNPVTLKFVWNQLTAELAPISPTPAVVGVSNVQISQPLVVNGLVTATFDKSNPCNVPLTVEGLYFSDPAQPQTATPGPVAPDYPGSGTGTWVWNAAWDLGTGSQILGVRICLMGSDFASPVCADSSTASFEAGLNADSLVGQTLSISGASQLLSSIKAVDVDLNGSVDLVGAVVTAGQPEILVLLATGVDTYQAQSTLLVPGGNANILSMTVVDLNGDTYPDILVSTSSTIARFVNHGEGQFVSDYTLAFNYVGAPTMVDLNRDGFLDLVIPGNSNVLVGLALADGSLPTAGNLQAYTVGAGTLDAVVAADIDLDGWPDVVAIGNVQQYAYALRGGPGGLSQVNTVTIPSFAVGSTMFVTDFAHTGSPQVAFLDTNGNINVIGNSGDANLLSNYNTVTDVSETAVDMQMADFNLDGYNDFLVVRTDGSLEVQLYSGGSYYSALQFNPSCVAQSDPNCVSAVAVADVNHDGTPDAAPLVGGVPQWWLNEAQISHALPVNGPPSAAFDTAISAMIVSDINNDGRLDLLVGLAKDDLLAVVWGLGNGQWQSTVEFSMPNPTVLATADFNGDGLPDFLAANGTTGVTGTFLSTGLLASPFNSGTYIEPGDAVQSLAAGDFNNDGNDDAIVGTTNAIATYLGDGTGNFTVVGEQISLGANSLVSLIAADLNADGILDLSVLTSSGSILIRLGVGDGTFSNTAGPNAQPGAVQISDGPIVAPGEVDLITTTASNLTVIPADSKNPGSFSLPISNQLNCTSPVGLSVASLYGTPADSVYLGCGTDSTVQAYSNGGAGAFSLNFSVPAGAVPTSVSAGAFFSPSAQAPVVATQGGAIATYMPYSGVLAPSQFTSTALSQPSVLLVADLDRNGSPDVIVADAGGALLSSNLKYTYTLGFQSGAGASTAGILTLMALGDVDRDGNLDVVGASVPTGQIGVNLGSASGIFANANALTNIPSVQPTGLALADLNSDGQLDIVVADALNSVIIAAQNNNGQFLPIHQLGLPIVPNAMVVGDINHDGLPDVVVADNANQRVFVQVANGAFSFGAVGYTALPAIVNQLALGDFNNDGTPDLVAMDTVGAQIYVLRGVGNGTFVQEAAFSAVGQPNEFTLADINRDGNLDIVCAVPTSGLALALLGNSQFGLAGVQALMMGEGAYSVVVVDIDLDGTPDVVTSNPPSGGFNIATNQLPSVGFAAGRRASY